MKGAVFSLCIALCITFAYSQTKAKVTAPTKAPTPKPTVAPGALKCRVYNVTIKLTNITFNDDLNNGWSVDHNNLRIELEAGIHQAFDGYRPFQALKVNTFSNAQDGKTLAQVFLEMKNNNTAHLTALIAKLAKGKLGVLPVGTKLKYAGCYFVAPQPMCSYGCPTVCAPSCSSSCCNQYIVPPPPVMIPAPPPPPAVCPAPCSPACAPSCSPSCCQTNYPASPYGKREHAPRPEKEAAKQLKKHILKKHNKKNTKH